MSTATQRETQSQLNFASQSDQPRALAAVATAYACACLVVPLRFHTRKRARMRYGWDDWLALSVLLPLSASFALFILQIKGGMGKHIAVASHTTLYQSGYIGSIACYSSQTILSKASVLCFYCRMFRAQWLTKLCWAIGIFVALPNLAMFIFDFVQCIPLAALFDGDKSKCTSPVVPLVTTGIINAVTDLLMLGIPLHFITRLNMRIARKVQVACIFLLGGAVCIFGILRIVAHCQIKETDPTYTMTWASTWSFCETAVTVVCACLPTLAFLLTRSKSKLEKEIRAKALFPFLRKNRSSTVSSSRRGLTRNYSNTSRVNSSKTRAPRHSVRVWAGDDIEMMGIQVANEANEATGESSPDKN